MNPVIWFEIYVNDMARATSFYQTVLQVTLQPLDSAPGVEMMAFPMHQDGTGAAGALTRTTEPMAGVEPGRNGTLVYFTCADCAVEAARAPAAGGTIIREKVSIGAYGFMALVADTEGNTIGLHSSA